MHCVCANIFGAIVLTLGLRTDLTFFDFDGFCAANICVYFQYLFMHCVCANIFGAIFLTLGLRRDQNASIPTKSAE
jgi:hypothetical protein